jgi:rod shape determining protein RodA
MNIGVMPVTGVPLPFFSYGGTQTLANFLMLALIMQATKEKVVVDSIEKLKFGDDK